MFQRLKNLLLSNRSIKQTVIKNFFWLVTGQLGTRIFRAFILIYAARILGAEGYGVFSYALGLAGFFTAFADIGVTSIVTREAAKYPEKRSEYFSTSFWMKIVLLTLSAGAIVLLAPYFSNIPAAIALIPFVAFLTFFDGLRDFTVSYFRSQEKMEMEAVIIGITNVAVVVLGFIALGIAPTPISFTYAYVGSSLLGTLSAIFILRNEFRRIASNFKKHLMSPILRAALPMAISSLFGTFLLNADYVILGWFRTATEIGYYSAAQKIVQILYVLPSLMATGIFPTISRLIGANDHERVRNITEKSLVAMMAIAIPVTIGGIILSAPIIGLIYGAAYLPATLSLQILISTLTFVFISSILGNLLFAYEKQKQTAVFIGIAAIINVVLDILLAPQFGIYGVSAGTLAVQFINVGLMLRLTKKVNYIKIFPHLKKIFAAAVIMGIVNFFLNTAGLNVILNIIVSMGVYGSMLFILREKLMDELKQLFGAI